MGARLSKVVLVSSTVIATTGATSSGVLDFKETLGDACAVYLVVGGTGTHALAVTQTVSMDGVTFVEPFDSTGSIGVIEASASATKWIQFTPAIAPYLKITVTGTASNGASTTAEATLVRQTN